MAKQVTDRDGAAEFVASAADTHAESVAQAVHEMFAPFSKHGEKLEAAQVALLFKLVARAVRASAKELLDASDAHDRELSDDAAPRKARDDAAAALTAEVVGVRSAVETVYGPAGLSALGIEGKTPVEPKGILSHGRKLAIQLVSDQVKWPKPLRKGMKLDPRAWVEEIDPYVKTLDAALKLVAKETREAQVTGDRKAKAMAAFDEVFSRSAGFIAATLTLVGERELAAKVRPSVRRPGTIADASEPAVGASDASGSTSDGASSASGSASRGSDGNRGQKPMG